MTETNAKFTRLLAQRAHGSLGQLCNLVDRCSRFGMSPKFSDIGFRIRTTSDFLFGLLSQLLLLILTVRYSTGDLLCTNPVPSSSRSFAHFIKTLPNFDPEMLDMP